MSRTRSESRADACVDALLAKTGKEITIGLPLGLGKPVHFINALYQRAKDDPSIKLHIVTALSLLAPEGKSFLEKRFLGPFTERLYGDIPELDYARDVEQHQLPTNVQVSEFFFKAGSYLNHSEQQRNYVCTNYTHAVRDLLATGVNVIAQLVSPAQQYEGKDCFSLSCNPDLSLDIMPLLRERQSENHPVAFVAETNSRLPWFGHHAAVPVDSFNIVLDNPADDYPLFSAPQTPISPQDHMIGFHASALLRDGGTLQVGIGSLGSALVHSTILRHTRNEHWTKLYQHLNIAERFPVTARVGGTNTFEQGLYGCSEMMVDGFIYLLEAGVLKRRVHDNTELQQRINRGEASPDEIPEDGIVMHGGFYLGPEVFYEKLRALTPEQRDSICMTSVNYINDLYDHRFGNQELKAAQRAHSRFINTAMMHTLDGAAVSDGLDDGRVVSGVGGQYNFVAMAHDLPDARSILALRSTRESGGDTVSNIVFSYGHCTIPRHLRDLVVTEYGIADLRGQPDEQVYLALIRIADSRFQADLLKQAQEAGKVDAAVTLPASWQNNTPESINRALQVSGTESLFEPFPFGCDFTEDELKLGKALKTLKADTATTAGKLATLGQALISSDSDAEENERLLARMALDKPKSWTERVNRKLVLHGLRKAR